MKRKITLLGYEARFKTGKFDRQGNLLWKKAGTPYPTVQAARDAGAEKITPRYSRAS